MSKKRKEEKKNLSEGLFLGSCNEKFELLRSGETKILKDSKSMSNSFLPVKVNSEKVYMTEPDGKLISNEYKQHKCDFLLYCEEDLQTCFIELKGVNISTKKDYNPYDQIIDTVTYLQNDEELKSLVSKNMRMHAFIVSMERQKIPKGVETEERKLWQKLVHCGGANKQNISELVHYVKVTKSDRYSNNKQIICSPKAPLPIPYKNKK